MDFRLLGSVEVVADGCVVPLGPPQQRLVLAVLAVEAGRVVTAETVIDRVWDEAPEGARRCLHVYISRLRQVLPCLVRRSGGYVLDVHPERVDVHRFRRLVACGDLGALREAVGLWRGEPASNVPGDWAAGIRHAWRQEYLDAVGAWAHAETRAGSPSAAIGRLAELTGEYPLAESLTTALMLALQAVGRPCEALTSYQRIRRRLLEELGMDPGPQLRAAHQAILRGEQTG